MEQLYFQLFFPDDEDEHSRNDDWECFHWQNFEQNKVKSKERSFEDFIGTSFVLIDADLLLIWMNNFQLCFRSILHHAQSCLPC